MQPIPGAHSGRTGIWWSVQAEEAPPAPVLATSLGEVLVVEQKPREAPVVTSPPVVASRSATQRFKARPSDGAQTPVDHLQSQDAWRQYLDTRRSHAKGPAACHGQALQVRSCCCPVTQQEFQQMARRLEESVSSPPGQVLLLPRLPNRSFSSWHAGLKSRSLPKLQRMLPRPTGRLLSVSRKPRMT